VDAPANIPATVEYPSKWAFIVGVTQYQNVRQLDFAGKDAEELAKSLRDELQFQNVVELHSNAAAQPERDIIINELNKLCTESGVGEDDLLLFFFSGHGVIDSNKDYILPVRAKLGTLADTGIQVERVIDYLKKSNCKNIVMFIDACRELVPGSKGVSVIGEASREALQQSGIITFFSCGPTDLSYEIEELHHSSFTYCLLEAIKSKQHQTVEQVDDYLRKNVPPLNVRYMKGSQLPYLVVEPLQKKALRIFTSLKQAEAVTKDFDELIARLANLCFYEQKLEEYFYEKAFEVVERARKGDLDEGRLRMIEWLIDEKLTPGTYMVTWRALERSKFGGLAIQKPRILGSIR
jgi:uncharacterized caspase-like protein